MRLIIFLVQNIYARSLGGAISDYAAQFQTGDDAQSRRVSVVLIRTLVVALCIILEGAALVGFSLTTPSNTGLGGAIAR